MQGLRSQVLWLTSLIVGFSLLFISPAYAYIDPGSGSIIFQAVVGGIMAAGLGGKLFWRRIRSFLARKR